MAIEAQRECRHKGKEIAQDRPRTLREQLIAVRMRIEPTRCVLRWLQRARSLVLEGLWPGAWIPRTLSQTIDWLEGAG